ncbi:hypothetical protein Pyrfu_0480 [Pyrolobus fumarii 1A]|uniref:Antitoxin SocA-like Panacea domain-containing protein n=1 Tax=Pyrolobus fumarii (strain DSM 11204 / 1A) TaxID=694429 RepID=G0EGH7_PYRF1|nr:UPF0175 family protein [Pyrolobus fumarii]AEM38351.1 hypothetical protein Pyrfu_0480 [Pyrolobus fumarii 1A]
MASSVARLSRDALRRVARGSGERVTLRDLILAALYTAGGKLSRLRLMKLLYIVSSHAPRAVQDVEFIPYRFGAWSEDVEHELEMLEKKGVTESSREGVRLRDINEGERAWQAVEKRGNLASLLRETLEIFNELDDRELLAFVYSVYGGYEESEKKHILLDKRLRLETALKLYERGLISVTLAARVAGMNVLEFVDIARRKLGGLVTSDKLFEE